MKKLFVVALLCWSASAFAENVFVKIGNIRGDSPDKEHKDWISVAKFSVGQSGPGTMGGSATAVRTPQVTFACRVGAWTEQ